MVEVEVVEVGVEGEVVEVDADFVIDYWMAVDPLLEQAVDLMILVVEDRVVEDRVVEDRVVEREAERVVEQEEERVVEQEVEQVV